MTINFKSPEIKELQPRLLVVGVGGAGGNALNEMIDNGIIHIIDAGYGSVHDGDQFVIAICDDCIKENLQDATLLYYGNYMYGKEGFVYEEIEKSKQKYRRRKNLDDIV